MKKTLQLLVLLILTSSCHTIKHICPCDFSEIEIVDNCELKLDVHISINKMPSIGPNNKGNGALLIAKISSTNGNKIPVSIKYTRFVVGFEEQDGFVGEFSEKRPSKDGNSVELIARNVKEFKEGVKANVAIELINSEDKRSYLTQNEVRVMTVY